MTLKTRYFVVWNYDYGEEHRLMEVYDENTADELVNMFCFYLDKDKEIPEWLPLEKQDAIRQLRQEWDYQTPIDIYWTISFPIG